MMANAEGVHRIALKVDCDTYEGTRDGIPSLLRALDARGIRATFFFTLGPDRSGRAIVRVFTRKGFLRKMIRSRAASMYGPRTLLSGTLLPAPDIGRQLTAIIRSVGDEGHEVGVHGWDQVRWHDQLDRMSEQEIDSECTAAHREFERIFGRRAHSAAAPGWHITERALAIQERLQLLYASNTRVGAPFFPASAGGGAFSTLEIPTTLPTWDETLYATELRDDHVFVEHYRRLIRGTEVHSIHTEVEGTAHAALFARQLDAWQSDGVAFVTLEEVAREQLAHRERVAVRQLARIELPGRAGQVTGSR
jgi:peptidoglycan/xylan/chitin deacetylase (PgdA/CDA1 family)